MSGGGELPGLARRELDDTDPMPFGKYSRTDPPTLMQDVPARYLHYLWTAGKEREVGRCAVADYIKRNLDALKMEHPDGIW